VFKKPAFRVIGGQPSHKRGKSAEPICLFPGEAPKSRKSLKNNTLTLGEKGRLLTCYRGQQRINCQRKGQYAERRQFSLLRVNKPAKMGSLLYKAKGGGGLRVSLRRGATATRQLPKGKGEEMRDWSFRKRWFWGKSSKKVQLGLLNAQSDGGKKRCNRAGGVL